QMLAEQLVEEHVAIRREVRPVPPEPVAALGGVRFAQRAVALLRRERREFFLEKAARVAEQIPRAVFLVLADPDVEVAGNPRTAVELVQCFLRRMALEVILDGATAELDAAFFQPAVKLAQEGLATVLECLPRVLAVEHDGDESAVARDVCG